MARIRRKKQRAEKREIKKRLFIVCEGGKTEPFYFNRFIRGLNFRGRPVQVKVVKSKKTDALSLVNEADRERKVPDDETWAVFDKNHYTKHHEAFQKAGARNINIAFSSISFEMWILLHFEYSTRAFLKSDGVMDHLRKKHLHYIKADQEIYDKIKEKRETAETNALRLRKEQEKTNAVCPVYQLNPYTNVDLLLHAIERLAE